MEVNEYDRIYGVMLPADVVEGRFGVLTTHTYSGDFGSETDLPGFIVPATADAAKEAKFVVTWPVDNRKFPAALTYPSFPFALRQGFDQTANAPFASTVYLTNPAAQEGLTIPSGTKALVFKGGRFTLKSGAYVVSGTYAAGAPVAVADTATNGAAAAGKIKLATSYDTSIVGRVYEYNSTTGDLTVEID